jgi:hypothetical protein
LAGRFIVCCANPLDVTAAEFERDQFEFDKVELVDRVAINRCDAVPHFFGDGIVDADLVDNGRSSK